METNENQQYVYEPVLKQKNVDIIKFPEQAFQSEAKAAGQVRQLMDLRLKTNPNENPEQQYYRTKEDVAKGRFKEAMSAELNTVALDETNRLANQLTGLFDGTQQGVVDVAESMTYLDEVRKYYTEDPTSYYQASLDMSKPGAVDDLNANYKMVKDYAFGLVAEELEKEGKLDTVADIAGYLVPDFYKDVADVFGGIEEFKKFHSMFNSMGPDEQMVLIEPIIEKFKEEHEGNSYKLGAAVQMLFEPDPSGSLFWGVFGDALSVPDAFAVAQIAKGVSRGVKASLPQRKVDQGAIEEAAQLQAVAAQGSKATEEALGVTKVDSAHSLNPHSTTLIDEGASIDGIAGEMDIVINRGNTVVPEETLPAFKSTMEPDEFKAVMRQAHEEELNIIKAELIADAGNKMSRGDVKNITKEIGELQSKLKGLEGLPVKGKVKEEITDLNNKITRLQSSLESAKKADKASRTLSKLEKGEVPRAVQTRITKATDKLAESKRAVKVAAEAETSMIAKGNIPDKFSPAIAKAVDEEVANIQAERQLLKEKPQPNPKEGSVGYVLPIAEETARATRAVKALILKPEALREEDLARAMARVQDRLKSDLNASGTQLNSIDIIERTDDGIKVKYTTTSGEYERTFAITHDDVGSRVAQNTDPKTWQTWKNHFDKLFSPEAKFEGFAPELVGDVTFLGQQVAKVRNGLANIWKDAERGLSRTENFQVNAILQAGDDAPAAMKKEHFTIAELRNGAIETEVGTFKLNPRQIESYYQKRALFREMHFLRSTYIRQKLEFEGYENLKYVDIEGVARELLGRKRKNFDVSDLDVAGREIVFFPNGWKGQRFHEGDYISTNRELLKDNNFEVVDLYEPFYTKDGKKVTKAIVNRDAKWTRLPNQVLHYQPGYVPRIYRNGYLFARNMDSDTREVLYAFDSKEFADKWAKEYRETTGKNVEIFRDGEFSESERLVEDANTYGGLYTGARKEQPLILKTPDGEMKLKRMDVGSATERYINNISKVMPYNEYRMVAMERWKKDVAAVKGGRTGLGQSQSFDTPAEKIDLNDDVKRVMVQQRDYIQETMGTKSRSETLMEGLMYGAANIMEGRKFLDKPRNWTLDNAKGNFTAYMKGKAHNLMMGWFNVKHLPLQLANASISMSLKPQYAVQAFGDMLAMNTLAGFNAADAIKAGKVYGFSEDTIESWMQYMASGLKDSIVRHADFNVHELGIGHVGLDVVRKASKAGKIFFNSGENAARLISWNIARREWKDLNPGKKIGDKDIIDISKEALRLQMNMQTENAAWWQNAPILGLATQFMPALAKFYENAAPKVLGGSTRWTPREKLQAVTGQLVLYGTVGVPVVEEAASWFAEANGQDPVTFLEENPNFVKGINEGFVGSVLGVFGADKTVPSENLNILGMLDDNVVVDVIKGMNAVINSGQEEEGFVSVMTGPSATVAKRFGNVFDGLVLTARTIVTVPSLEVAHGAILSNVNDILSMTSTWTNGQKAYYLESMGKLFSASGKLIATEDELGEFSLINQLMHGMGFKTRAEVALYASKEAIKGANQYKQDVKKQYKEILREYLNTGNEELFNARKSVLLSIYKDRPDTVIEVIDDGIGDTLDGKTEVSKTAQTNYRMMVENRGDVKVQQATLNSEVGKQ